MNIFEARDPKNPDRRIEYLPHQDAYRFSEYRNEYIAGGWRSGKSYGVIGFSEVSMQCNPGCDGAIIEPDYKLLEDFLEKKFKPAFAPYIIGEKKTHYLYRIFMKTGITVLGLSGHNLDKLEQYELGWAVADEAGLMGRELFVRLNARVNDNRARRQRIGYAGIPRYGWLADTFAGEPSPLRHMSRASTLDNPTLAQETIDGLLDACPARMKPAYIDGLFVPPGGSIHPGFSDRNFIDWPEFDRLFLTGVVIDWSPRRPHVLFFQVIPAGSKIPALGRIARTSVVVFDEIYEFAEDPITTPRLCEYVKAKRYPLKQAIGDPAGGAVEATSGTSSRIQASESLRLPIESPPKNMSGKAVRIEHVNLALEPLTGLPTLFIARHMESDRHPMALVPSFRGYSYKKDKDGVPSSDINEDGITEHSMDCIQYLVSVVLPKYERLTGPQTRSYI